MELTQGDIAVGSDFTVDGARYRRIGVSSIRPVGADGQLAGRALALIPEGVIDNKNGAKTMRNNTNFIRAAKQAADAVSDEAKGRRFGTSCKTINWTKRGACHVGTSGAQRFVAMPDGAGKWLLTEVGLDGQGELIAHDLYDETTAMIVALDHVVVDRAPWWLAAILVVVMVLLLVAVNVRPPV